MGDSINNGDANGSYICILYMLTSYVFKPDKSICKAYPLTLLSMSLSGDKEDCPRIVIRVWVR